MGRLTGGQTRLPNARLESGSAVSGNVLGRVIAYAMAVLEANAFMGVIVAAPR